MSATAANRRKAYEELQDKFAQQEGNAQKKEERNAKRRQAYRRLRAQTFLDREECAKHYPPEDVDLLAAIYLQRFNAEGAQLHTLNRIYRNFRAAQPKIGWQDEARAVIERIGA